MSICFSFHARLDISANTGNTAKLAIVTLSVAKPLGSLPVVQRSSDCHGFAVSGLTAQFTLRQVVSEESRVPYFMSSGLVREVRRGENPAKGLVAARRFFAGVTP